MDKIGITFKDFHTQEKLFHHVVFMCIPRVGDIVKNKKETYTVRSVTHSLEEYKTTSGSDQWSSITIFLERV